MSKVIDFYEKYIQKDIGLYAVIGAELCNSWMIVACKLLETGNGDTDLAIHPFQILFVRMIATYIGCLLYIHFRQVEDAPFGPKDLRWAFILRGVLGFAGVSGLYYPLIYLSVSDVISIQFIAPTVTALIAYIFLKEKFTKWEALGGMVSLGGVMLIAKPEFLFGASEGSHFDNNVETSDPRQRIIAVIVLLLGLICGTGSFVTIRYVGHRADAVMMISYFALISIIFSFFSIVLSPSLSFKVPGTSKQWLLFIVIGVTGFFMQFLMTFGMQYEKASRASSMMYIQIVFGIAWEYLIWHHLPNIWSWVGTFIILSTSFCVFYFKSDDTDDFPDRPFDEEEDLDTPITVTHEQFDIPLKNVKPLS